MKNKRLMLIVVALAIALTITFVGCERGNLDNQDVPPTTDNITIEYMIGDTLLSSSSVASVGDIVLPKSDRQGYTLVWYLDRALTSPIIDVSTITVQDGKAVLYGEYVADTVTVEIRLNDTANAVRAILANISVPKGSSMPDIDYASMTIEGHPEYIFTGTDYEGGAIDSDIAVNVTFQYREYTLTAIDGESTTTHAVTYGDSVTLTHKESVLADFVGWADETGEIVDIATFVMPNRDVTLVAKYEARGISADIEPSKERIMYGDSILLTLNVSGGIDASNIELVQWYKSSSTSADKVLLASGKEMTLEVAPDISGMVEYSAIVTISDGSASYDIEGRLTIEVLKADETALAIRWIESATYTGSECQPLFEVYNTLNGAVLDVSYYTYEYGDDTHNLVDVTSGVIVSVFVNNNVINYSSTAVIASECDIAPLDISKADNIRLEVIHDGVYTSRSQVSDIALYYAGVKVNTNADVIYRSEAGDIIEDIVDAGEYTITYDVTNGGNANFVGAVSSVISVAKADVTIEASDISATYDGSAHSIAYTTNFDVDVAMSVAGEPFVEAVNAGTYDVLLSFAGNASLNAVDKVVTITIAKAKSEISLAKNDFVYAKKDYFDSLEFAISNSEQNVEATRISMVNAGDYTIHAIAEATPNYERVEKTFSRKVARRNASVIAPSYEGVFDYGMAGYDNGIVPNITGVIAGDSLDVTLALYRDTLEVTAPSLDAGVYSIKAIVSENANYDIAVKDGTFTVAKKPLLIEDVVVSGIDGLTYDGCPHDVMVQLRGGRDGDSIVSDINGGVLSVVDAGEYTLTISSVDAVNYALASPLAVTTFLVNRAVVDVPVLADSTKVYDAKEVALVSQEGYTITYRNNVGDEIASIVDAGTYSIVLALVSDNYIWADKTSESKELGYTIKRQSIVLTWSHDELVYNFAMQCPTATLPVTPDSLDLTINGGATDVGNYEATAVLTGERKANYTIANGNYAYNIVALDATCADIVLSEEEHIYSGSAETLESVRASIQGHDIDCFSTEYTDNVHSGTAKVDIIFSGNLSGSVSRTFVIAPLPVTARIQGVTTNMHIDSLSNANNYLSHISLEIDAMQEPLATEAREALSGATLSVMHNGSAVTDFVEPGSYAVEADFGDQTNGDFVFSAESCTFEVRGDNAYIAVSGRKLTHNKISFTYGEPLTMELRYIGDDSLVPSVSATMAYVVDGTSHSLPTNGGTYSIAVTIANIDGITFVNCDNTYNFTLTIDKAVLVADTYSTTKVYGVTWKDIASELALPTYNGGEVRGTWSIDDTLVQMDKGDIANTATFEPNETDNYSPVTIDVLVCVTARDLSSSARILGVSDVIYDGTNKTHTIEVLDVPADAEYDVTYADNVNVGTAKTIVTFKGNYSGMVTATFNIKAMPIKVRAEGEKFVHLSDGITLNTYLSSIRLTYSGVNANITHEVDSVLAETSLCVLDSAGHQVTSLDVEGDYTLVADFARDTNFALTLEPFAFSVVSRNAYVAIDGVPVRGDAHTSQYRDNMVLDIRYVKGENRDTPIGDITYSVSVDGVATTTMPTAVGTYNILVTLESTTYYISKENTHAFMLEIARGELVADTFNTATTFGAKDWQDIVAEIPSPTYRGEAVLGTWTIGDESVALDAGRVTNRATFLPSDTGYAPITIDVAINVLPLDITHTAIVGAIDNMTYTGKALCPAVAITNGDKCLILDTDYTIEYSDNVNVGTAHVVIAYKGNYKGGSEATFEIEPKLLDETSQDYRDTAVPKVVYSGDAKRPVIEVYDGAKKLVRDVDYTLTYINNVDAYVNSEQPVLASAGENTAPTIIITMIGNYKGTVMVPFEIERLDASGASATIGGTFVYNAKPQMPTDILVTLEGIGILNSADYELAYDNNINATRVDGMASVIITFVGNYTGSKVVTFDIAPLDASSAEATIEGSGTHIFSHTAIEPSISLNMAGYGIVESAGYDIVYGDNVNAGTASVTVTFKDNFVGSMVAHFEIQPLAVTDATIKILDSSIVYDGSVKTPAVRVLADNGRTMTAEDVTITYSGDRINATSNDATIRASFKGNYSGEVSHVFDIAPMDASGAVLTIDSTYSLAYTGNRVEPPIEVNSLGALLLLDRDYDIAYVGDAVNVSSEGVDIVVTFKGNYTGSPLRQNYKIAPMQVKDIAVEMVDNAPIVYDGTAKTPEVRVLGDGSLLDSASYNLTYSKNTNAGSADISVVLRGNYKGSKVAHFAISKCIVTDITMTSPITRVYSGELAVVRDTDISGKLTSGKYVMDDYTYTVKSGLNAGEDIVIEVTLSDMSNFSSNAPIDVVVGTIGKVTKLDFVGDTYHVPYGDEVNNIIISSACSYNGKAVAGVFSFVDSSALGVAGSSEVRTLHFVPSDSVNYPEADYDITIIVDKKDITGATLSVDNATYTGASILPVVRVEYEGALIAGREYTLDSVSIVDAGEYNIAITLVADGNYTSKTKIRSNMTVAKATLCESNVSVTSIEINEAFVASWQDVLGVLGNEVVVTFNGMMVDGTWSYLDVDGTLATTTRNMRFAPSSTNYNVLDINMTFNITTSDMVVSDMSYTPLTYNGTDQTPIFTAKVGNKTITSQDYTLEKTESIGAGTYSAKITFNAGTHLVGTEADGSLILQYSIAPYIISKDKIMTTSGDVALYKGYKVISHTLEIGETLTLGVDGWHYAKAGTTTVQPIMVKLAGIDALIPLSDIVYSSSAVPAVNGVGCTYLWNIGKLSETGNFVFDKGVTSLEFLVKVQTIEIGKDSGIIMTIEDAILELNASGGEAYMLADTTFSSRDIMAIYGIDGDVSMSNGTLVLPYEIKPGTLYKVIEDKTFDTDVADHPINEKGTTMTLRVPSHVGNINIVGSASLYVKSRINGGWNGSPTGKDNRIVLEKGVVVTLGSPTAKIDATGYIIGEGEIVAHDGVLNDTLVIGDCVFGGSLKAGMWQHGKFLPFKQYSVNNIEVKTTIHHNARYGGHWAFTADSNVFTDVANILAPDGTGLFQSLKAGGYIVKTFDNFNSYYDLTNGDYKINAIKLGLSLKGIINIDLDSSVTVLPFPGNMRFNLKGSMLSIDKEIMFLPGTTMNVDASSKLTIMPGGALYMYQESMGGNIYHQLVAKDENGNVAFVENSGIYPITHLYYRYDYVAEHTLSGSGINAVCTYDYDEHSSSQLIVDGTLEVQARKKNLSWIIGKLGGIVTTTGSTGTIVVDTNADVAPIMKEILETQYVNPLEVVFKNTNVTQKTTFYGCINDSTTKMTPGATYKAQNGQFVKQ